MNQLKILIVEDELIVAEDMKTQLRKIGYDIVGLASSYAEAVKIINDIMPDMVIVDIIIKGSKSGIDVGKYLDQSNIPFIYLTSHSDRLTVEQAKETHPNAYLLKPFRPENLFTCIEIAIGNAASRDIKPCTAPESEPLADNMVVKDSLFIKKGHLFYKIKIKDILFVKADGNYLAVYVNNNNKFLIRSTIKGFMQFLHPFNFFQTHKSYIINIEYIDVVSYTFIKIQQHEIPLSKYNKDDLMARMKSFS